MLKVKENKSLEKILDSVLENIPENCRGNYNRNIETLTIGKFNKNNNFGAYRSYKNAIYLNIDKLYSKKEFDSQTDFNTYVIKHELYHAFSSDSTEKDVLYSGFCKDDFSKKRKKSKHNYLNEGFTDLLCIPISDKNFKTRDLKHHLASQLSLIVGMDIMKEAYFNNLGIEPLKNELINQGNDDRDIENFFNVLDDLEEDMHYGDGFASFTYVQDKLMEFCNKKLETLTTTNEKRMLLERFKASIPNTGVEQYNMDVRVIEKRIKTIHAVY